jgi:hypothetical protein
MSKQSTPITPTLLLDASRLPNSSEVEIERTLYSVCKRSTSKTIYGHYWHETTLYADEDCTQLDYLKGDGELNNNKINTKLIMQYTALLADALQRNIEQTKALISVYDDILNNLITSKDDD